MNSVTDQREVTEPAPPRHAWGAWFDLSEPHLVRGPFSRWPHVADSVLAVVVFVVSVIAVAVSVVDDAESFSLASVGDEPVGDFVLLAAAAAALLWRRRRPIAVTAAVLVVMIAWAVAGYGDGHDLALIVAIYSVGRYTTDRRQNLAIVGAAVAVSIVGTIIDSHQRVDVVPALLVVGLPWYVGRRVRNRGDYLALLHERTARLESDQLARARQAVADERARIARELHDVVAHRVSMMTVQAGAAKTVARHDLDAAIDAMGDVEQGGRAALGELRHLLGVLRPETTAADDLGPQPGLSSLSVLTDELAGTGAQVTLAMADLPAELAAAVDLSAYRIVQEAVTNIIKHAGPAPIVDVTVDVDGRGLVLDISNTVAAADATTRQGRSDAGLPASGLGIVGMRERTHLLGGSLEAGLERPDRYRVRAHIPIGPAS